jgi:hypothetical protein
VSTRKLAVSFVLAAATLAASARAEAPALRLVWVDPAGTASGSEDRARDECLALLEQMNLSAQWRRGRASEIAEPGEVRVILLDRGAKDRAGDPVLGSTPSRFEGAPFVWIHVPSVRAALGYDSRRTLAPERLLDRRALGTALGRVAAHELVHALAPWVPHGAGLMSRQLTRRDLTASTLAVAADVGPAVRAALDGSAPPARPDTGLLAAGATREPRR